ncbi:acyltransferase [Janthinobacterium fluminis]|uniref:acyltransferase n=1 Tax=Janthinobacterium fluminis TaxID=2987524 RepID=UPI003078B9E9
MNQIHPTATVDAGAKIGAHTAVWHYAHVEAGAVIGEHCNLGQNVYVGNQTVIGHGCRLGNSVAVFSHVELGNFVFCAPFMVFTHIAFPRACVSRRANFEKTIVKDGVSLGANATVVPGITIGTGTFLAAGSTLTRDSKDWALMVGAPARQLGWVSAYGEKIPLPLSGEGEWHCPHTGDAYHLCGSELRRQPGPRDILHYTPGGRFERMTASAVTATAQTLSA